MVPVHETNGFVEIVCILIYLGPILYVIIRSYFDELYNIKQRMNKNKESKKEE
jgi:hypothetical protein